jgi:hypothetical protein
VDAVRHDRGRGAGVTQANVDEMLASDDPSIQRLLGVTGGMGQKLGIDDKWAYNIVKQVGNYGEVFERNVGMKSRWATAARPERAVDRRRPAVRPADPLRTCGRRLR